VKSPEISSLTIIESSVEEFIEEIK
jgi:hypothetical protein